MHVVIVQTKMFRCLARIPDVWLGAAGAGNLVLGKVSVVRRGDEVVGQRAAHVLVDSGVVGVDHIILLGQHAHGETVLGHELVLLSCNERHSVPIESIVL